MNTIDNDNDALVLGTAIADDVAKDDIWAHKDADVALPASWFSDLSTRAVAKSAFYGRLEVLRGE